MAKLQTEKPLEFNQVINHEGKLYLALELMVSKTIKSEDILRPHMLVDMLVKAYQVRLDRCQERLQWAIAHNRIVAIEGCDSSHIYYESSAKLADACFKSEISSYSLTAAQAMKEALAEFKKTCRGTVDGRWLTEHFSPLQIQQLIKAIEELLAADDQVFTETVNPILGCNGRAELFNYLNWLHEAYVISWQMSRK